METTDDFASEHRRRLIDDYNRRDNRAIVFILIAVAVLGVTGVGVIVVLDVTDPVASAKPVPATVVPRGEP